MIRGVQCHEFALVEEVKDASKSKKSKFQKRLQPKKLREVLSLNEIKRPFLSKNDQNKVLIETRYAGIQYPDALQAKGLYQVKPNLPYIPGMDLTGFVVKVGSSVSNLKVGDRVLATMLKEGGTGGMSEIVKASSNLVYKLPDNVPMEACANIGRNYFAAYHSLKTIGKIGPSSLVLVDGASGGVGMATIELAKAMVRFF